MYSHIFNAFYLHFIPLQTHLKISTIPHYSSKLGNSIIAYWINKIKGIKIDESVKQIYKELRSKYQKSAISKKELALELGYFGY